MKSECWSPLSTLKSVVVKFDALQLITQQVQMSLLILRELSEYAKDFSIILDDVAITELIFSQEYMAAVEAKRGPAGSPVGPVFGVES